MSVAVNKHAENQQATNSDAHHDTRVIEITPPHNQTIIVPSPTARRIDRWIADWLLEKVNLSNSKDTYITYAAIVEDYRTALLVKDLDLDRFDRLDDLLTIAAIYARFSARGQSVKTATIRLRYAGISSFYEFCVRQGQLPFNPMDRIKRPKAQRRQGARPLDGEVVAARIASIEERNLENRHVRADVRPLLAARDEALLLVYFETCRRLREVASLTWGDMRVNEATGCVTLRYRRLKGGKKAEDTLSADVSEALLTWLELFYGVPLARKMTPTTPLWVALSFGGKDGPSYGRQLGEQAIGDLCQKYLGDSRVHITRHTGAKIRLDEGSDLRKLKEKLNHSSLAVTDLYVEDLTSEEDEYAESVATTLLSHKRKRARQEES